ncbi:hypothetical protein BT96DRAFT_317190 [Gymnopus androsaceus JB14]|uniref:Uncharacterized protein n=1 Tax=Gymnopus androsaceus JB14 TaxID=1447944 RepID=A0A6A4I751_9AGAR|nr:hypothetical protein BT96DRAFT_317190 [Gymnopus androsaceus JB14]
MSISDTLHCCVTCQLQVDTFPRQLDHAYQRIHGDLSTKTRSNAFFSPAERSQLQPLISSISNDLQKYDEAIARLQEQRAQLAKLLEYPKSLASPSHIRQLPPEIMSEIFKMIVAGREIDFSAQWFGYGKGYERKMVATVALHTRIHAYEFATSSLDLP